MCKNKQLEHAAVQREILIELNIVLYSGKVSYTS